MKPLEVSKEATEEIDYLNSNWPGKGDEFEADVKAALELIEKQPKAFSPYRKKGYRKYVLTEYGYLIFYRELDDSVWVAAISHGKRKPDYWIKRKPT